MKSILISVLICLGLIFTQDLQAQKLKKFASSIEKKLGTKKIKVSYTDVVFYLGYAELGIEEDIKKGDHSGLACIPENATGSAELLVKENGILAGIRVAQAVFQEVDPKLEMEILLKDGDKISIGDIAFYLTGSRQSILKGERLALNLMQRMSAIATETAKYTQLLKVHSS